MDGAKSMTYRYNQIEGAENCMSAQYILPLSRLRAPLAATVASHKQIVSEFGDHKSMGIAQPSVLDCTAVCFALTLLPWKTWAAMEGL